ncbi:MAG: DUF4842 domain-containing protein [Prevotella sp.]|nr:DUF4842 domain-containing protein [Prevotella sp.]
MKKVYLMKGMAVMAFGLVVASCNKTDLFNANAEQETKQVEFAENFKNSVMGGRSIDPNQTWSTAVSAQVNVNLNLDYGETYDVYIFTSNPVLDKNAAYLGTAVIASGQTKAISFARPADVQTLYAAYMDSKGNMFAIPFSASEENVTLGVAAKGASHVARRAGEATVSITTINTPDVSTYKTDAVALTDNNAASMPNGAKMIIEKGTKLTAILGNVKQTNGGTVYVEGEWEISGDQRFGAGTRLIIANGGKVTVKEGANLLNNNANDDKTILPGLLYVMAGGKLTGDGFTDLCNAVGNDMCFIGGTVDVKTFNINGSKVYVAEGGHLLSEYLQNGDEGGIVINHGEVHVKSASDTNDSKGYNRNMAIENACQFTVDYQLTLGDALDSKIADGGYLSVGGLFLNGGTSHDGRLVLGENSIVEIGQNSSNSSNYQGNTISFGQIYFNNFGAAGPTTENQNRAFIKCLSSYERLNYTNDYDKMSGKITWILDNGNSNISWVQDYGFFVNGPMFGTSANYTIDTSECTAGIEQKENTGGDPKSNYIYYAFEDLGTTDDFDFNDVVIRVSAPNASGESTVELVAAGGTMPTHITYNNTEFNSTEIHELLHASAVTEMINTGRGPNKDFETIGTLRGLTAATDMTNLNFGISITGNNGQVLKVTRSVAGNGQAPLVVVVSGDNEGKWFWPTERTKISDAYQQFGAWGANVENNADWYKNATKGKVFVW